MNFKKYIGISYKHRGRDFSGCDCYGLFSLIYMEERNIVLPDFLIIDYDLDWYKKGKACINEGLDQIIGDWKVIKTPDLFDAVLLYNLEYPTIVSHIGMCIGDNKIIHVTENETSRVDRLSGLIGKKVYKSLRYVGDVDG